MDRYESNRRKTSLGTRSGECQASRVPENPRAGRWGVYLSFVCSPPVVEAHVWLTTPTRWSPRSIGQAVICSTLLASKYQHLIGRHAT